MILEMRPVFIEISTVVENAHRDVIEAKRIVHRAHN